MVTESRRKRCSWCESSQLYRDYHDQEWGVPLMDDHALFRLLMLEGQQAGLAWITVLNKRTHMDEVFFGFDPNRLATVSAKTMESWLQDSGLIRHRGKLAALVSNARCALAIADFAEWLWSFAPPPSAHSSPVVPTETLESQAMSKALKKAGFRFVGPTICYAFMQSAGMVNDHQPECWRFKTSERLVIKALKARRRR